MPSDFKIKTLRNNYGEHLNDLPLEEDQDENVSVDDKESTTVFHDMRESALLKAVYISSAVKGVTLGLNASTEKENEEDNLNCSRSEKIFDSSVLQTSTPEKSTPESSVNNSKCLKRKKNLEKNLSPIVIDKKSDSENNVSVLKLLNEIDFQRRLTVDKVMRERIQNMYDTGKLIKDSLEHLKQTRLEEAIARRLFLERKILDDIHEQEILNKPKREAQWARDNLKEAQRIQERNQKVKDAEEEAKKKSEAILIKRKLIDKILFELQKEYNQEYKNVLEIIKSCKDKPALSEITVVQSKMLKDCALVCESLLKKCKQGDVTEDDVEGAKILVDTIKAIHNCLKSEIEKLNNAVKTEAVKVEEVKKTEVEQITPSTPKKEASDTSVASGMLGCVIILISLKSFFVISRTSIFENSVSLAGFPPTRPEVGKLQSEETDIQYPGNTLKEIWDIREEKPSDWLKNWRRSRGKNNNSWFVLRDAKMAIDLPETIPSIINSFKRSNSAKTLQKLTRNLKSCEKTSRFSFLWPRSCKSEQCRCAFPNCKDCQTKLNGGECNDNDCRVKSAYITCQNFDNNNESDAEGDCEQTLLSGLDVKSDLNFDNVYDWSLRDNETDGFPDKYWKGSSTTKDKYFGKEKQDNEGLLNSSYEIRKRRKRVFLLSSLGLALLSVAIFIRLFDPLEKILNWKLSLAPGTFVLDLWLAPPVTVYVKIYIFNFTNSNEFLAGKEKLKVQQVGPYVYTEHLENTNPIFHPNGTLSYIPRRTVKAVPELSVANPKLEKVIVPNIPFLGLASMIADSSMFINLPFFSLARLIGSKPFLNLTVHDYLWGYNDPLVKMANKVVRTKIPFSSFGLLERMYDEGHNVITIRLKDNGLNMTDKGYLPQYTIDTWNGSPGLTAWGYRPEDFNPKNGPVRPEPIDRCKLIRGASDGVIFPRNMSPKIVHQVYRKNFCRIIPLIFEKEGITRNGIPGYWYKLPVNVFDPPEVNPAQACYCNPNTTKCLPKGLSDITPCYYNIPAAVSLPHFLDADPKLLEDVDGLSPDREKHGTNIILQPNLGMPMEFQTRIQTNIIMKKIRFNPEISLFSEIVLPIVWIELALDGLPAYINFLIYLVVFIVPGILTAFVVISFVCGIGLLIYSTINCLILAGLLEISSRGKSKYLSIKVFPMIDKKKIATISRKNSIMSAINSSRKNSLIMNHKPLSNI